MTRFKGHPAVNFAAVYLVAVVIFVGIHSATFTQEPMIGDDSLAGALPHNPNLIIAYPPEGFVLSRLSYEQEPLNLKGFQSDEGIPNVVYYPGIGSLRNGGRLPWQLQERQSGIPHAFFQILFSWHMEPMPAFLLYKILTSLVVILLVGLFLHQVGGRLPAAVGMLLLAIDPMEVLSFGPTIAEPWQKIVTLVALNLFLLNRNWAYLMAGLVTAFGFFLQVNFLWCAVVLAVVVLMMVRPLKSALIRSLTTFAVGILPTLFQLRWKELFSEIGDHGYQLKDGTPIVHYPVKDLINLIVDKADFYAAWFDPTQVLGQRGWAWHMITPSIFGIVALAAFLAWLIPTVRRRMSPSAWRWCLTLTLALLAFFAAMWATTSKLIVHMQYLITVNWLVIAVLAILAAELWRQTQGALKALVLCGILFPQLALSMEWAARYREQGPMPLINANLHEKVLQRIRRIKTVPVFAISYGDMATYEFLSSGEVWPFHAVRMTEDYERFPTLIAMMKYLRHGALVVTLSDQWSSWYHNWGPLDPQQVIRDALAQGIKVEYEPIYLRAEQEVGLFSFSVAGEEANR